MTRWLRIGSLLLLTGVAACSDGDKTPASGTPAGAGETKTVKIDAATGGTVKVGSAALDIPGGSLGSDVDVTVETAAPSADLPDSASLTGLLYDFGPDGTTFDPPAKLTLPLATVAAAGKEAVVSFLDEKANAWVDLETTSAGGKVTASIAHFTKFIVRFRDAGAGPVDCAFAACGGDLVGAWTITSACVDKAGDAGTDNPFGAGCPDAVFDVAIDATGTATFGADASFDLVLQGTPSISVTIPSSCLSSGALPFPDCTVLADALDKNGGVTCTGDTASGCQCSGTTGSSGPTNQHKVGTYVVSGTTVTTTTAADGGTDVGAANPYCVSGTTLKVHTEDGTVIVATKK